MTHICVSEWDIIGSNNSLSPGRRQAIIWTNAWILFIGPLGTNFGEILIEIHIFSFAKMHLIMSFGKWQPFCLVLNELMLKGFRCHEDIMIYLHASFWGSWRESWLSVGRSMYVCPEHTEAKSCWRHDATSEKHPISSLADKYSPRNTWGFFLQT